MIKNANNTDKDIVTAESDTENNTNKNFVTAESDTENNTNKNFVTAESDTENNTNKNFVTAESDTENNTNKNFVTAESDTENNADSILMTAEFDAEKAFAEATADGTDKEKQLLEYPVLYLRDGVAFPAMAYNTEEKDKYITLLLNRYEPTQHFFVTYTDTFRGLPVPLDGLSEWGVIAEVSFKKIEEDTYKISVSGISRASMKECHRNGSSIVARVEPFPYSKQGINEEEAFSRDEVLAMGMIRREMKKLTSMIPADNREVLAAADSFLNPSVLADYAAMSCLSRSSDKLDVLAETDVLKRCRMVVEKLAYECEICLAEINLSRRIHQNFEENQYDNYLREKMKVIRDELGDDASDEDMYLEKIEQTVFSRDSAEDEKIREKLIKEVLKLRKMPFGSSETAVIKGYIETVLELPFGVYTEDTLDVAAAEKILDADHDGLEKPKERILEYLAVKQLSPELRGQILCFVGPPGVGKTSLGKSIAKAMNRKFARVSLGGVDDEAEIRGHRKTYLGSMPGRIIDAVKTAGSCNPVILFDEIDKMSSSVKGDPASAMLEVFDTEQNKSFRDHYLEIPFDLSDCLFIATANNLSNIPSPLMDRMEIIELSTYTDEEKLAIAKNHLVPKQLERHGLNKNQLKFKDEGISEIIDGYTRESGVRNLEREIAAVCRKAAKSVALGQAKSMTVSRTTVKKYLGARHNYNEKCADCDLVGVVNGLAYTSVGGDILKIETAVMPGDGKIRLTGSLGDVMKESAELAVSFIRANSETLDIEKDFYKKYDIHIHVPEGATPKDGPSAGVTMLTSLVSALSGRPVRQDVAMTGELTLTGRVLPIGGLKEKTFAAYKAGVKTVIVPGDNIPDLEKIDKAVRDSVTFVPATKAQDVLGVAIR